MTRQRVPLVYAFVLLATVVLSSRCTTARAADVGVQVVGVYVFPDTPLTSIEGFIKNDRKILLGGIGSDLWHAPDDAPNCFWMVSDRGPNGELRVGAEKRRTFPVPDFSPAILHVQVGNGRIKLLQTIPIVDAAGNPVGGLSNIEGVDETPYDYQGRHRLSYDPNGLDTEGLVRTTRGDFWLAEEYSPSLVHCDPDGKILKRFIPAGLKLKKTTYPVVACLPGILAQRKRNRGFEGLTLVRNGTTLYAVMQSPLSNPNNHTAAASRNIRLLAFDIAQERPVAEYAYRLESYKSFGPSADKPSDIKVSGLAMLDKTTMLVLERTDEAARLNKVDLSRATNILDGKWDRTPTSPSLESLNDLSAAGVTAPTKSLVVDLSQLPNMPEKIEGVAIVDARTIAVANDNDFDLGTFDSAGNNHGAGTRSVICVLRLEAPPFDKP